MRLFPTVVSLFPCRQRNLHLTRALHVAQGRGAMTAKQPRKAISPPIKKNDPRLFTCSCDMKVTPIFRGEKGRSFVHCQVCHKKSCSSYCDILGIPVHVGFVGLNKNKVWNCHALLHNPSTVCISYAYSYLIILRCEYRCILSLFSDQCSFWLVC